MRKRPLLIPLLLASLLLSPSGAHAADPVTAEPGQSFQTAIPWAPGTAITWPDSGLLWLAVPLEAGRSVTFVVPGAGDIDLYSTPKSPIGGQCEAVGDLSCTFLPTGTGTFRLRLQGSAGAETTPLLLDGKSAASAYQLGAIKNQRWVLPTGGSGWWQFPGQPEGSVWAFTVPGATSLSVWDGERLVAQESGPGLRFTATDAESLTLQVEAKRTSYYSPTLWAEGTSAIAPSPWDLAESTSITMGSSRLAWVAPSGLLPGQTNQLFLEGATNLATQTTTGRYLPTACEKAGTGLQCRISPPLFEELLLRISAPANATVTLTGAVGTAEAPFQINQLEKPGRPFQIEPETDAFVQLPLEAGTVHLKVPGASRLSLDLGEAAEPVEANGEWLTATIPTTGTYNLQVTAGMKGLIQVQRYRPGDLPELAVPLDPTQPFTTPISDRRLLWVQVNGLTGRQSFQFRSSARLTPATLGGAGLASSQRAVPGGFEMTFTPAINGSYLLRLAGAPGPTTLTMSGQGADNPLALGPNARLSIPEGRQTWVTVAIPAAGRWGISVPGARSLALTAPGATTAPETTDLAPDLLVVETEAAASYILTIEASKTGLYTPVLVGNGGLRSMALPIPEAGTTFTVPSNQTLWLEAAGLTAEERYTIRATNKPLIQFYDSSDRRVAASCSPAGSLQICNVTVPADGKLWLRLTGAAGLKTRITIE